MPTMGKVVDGAVVVTLEMETRVDGVVIIMVGIEIVITNPTIMILRTNPNPPWVERRRNAR